MIRSILPGVLAFSVLAPVSAQNENETEAPAEVVTEPIAVEPDAAAVRTDSSYALGYRTGVGFSQQFGRFGVTADDLETETFFNGFMAAVKGEDPEFSEERLQAAMVALGTMLEKREEEAAEANLKAGEEFLEENGKREGVVTTESGLQYEVIEAGGEETYEEAPEGMETNFMVHYRGTLIDGTEFDKSPEGEPVPMSLQVIDGFREALTSMPVGAKWKLFIPSGLAYGPERRSQEIGANSVLIFELELVSLENVPAQPQQGFPFPMPGQ